MTFLISGATFLPQASANCKLIGPSLILTFMNFIMEKFVKYFGIWVIFHCGFHKMIHVFPILLLNDFYHNVEDGEEKGRVKMLTF